ncbi:MAG: hypothetical protein IGS54_04525 [Elainella sp. C42_A2020_010]|nr:hypothetical protein [Elainella sp. C42_A2020_010]
MRSSFHRYHEATITNAYRTLLIKLKPESSQNQVNAFTPPECSLLKSRPSKQLFQ